MRVELAAATAAFAVVILCGCSSTAEGSLTVREDGGEGQTISVPDLQCVTTADRFSASSTQGRVGELSAFIATISPDADEAITWVNLGDDRWFLTSEVFDHDAAVTFDEAEGRIGTSAQGYPTEFDASGTIDGALSCTVQKSF
ncbi:MAG: hypothetical protein QM630_02590 [Microbacterium sp.]